MSWKLALGAVAVVATLAGTSALALFVVGAYDVRATEPHPESVEWALRSTMEASVRSGARDVQIPPEIDTGDRALAARAIGHYSVACASCHAAPGKPRAPWMVLYPEPADLTQAAVVARWTDQELYFIIKNGIKDTGMIALGPTHAEEDVWAVTAFVRQLPRMSVAEYEELVAKYQASQLHAHHGHPHGDSDAEGKPTFTCPHHPEVVAHEPGNCPKCNMPLEPKR